MPKISALPAMTTADGDDPAPIVDDSAGSTKKITLTKMKEWLQSLVGWISTAMLADAAVTNVKLGVTSTTDANSWKVIDLGTVVYHHKRVTFSQACTANTNAGLTVSSNNLPVGMATLSTNYLHANYASAGNGGDVKIVTEMTTSSASLGFVIRTHQTATYSGFIDVMIVTT